VTAARGRGKLVGEVTKCIASAVARAPCLTADDCPRLFPALRREQEGRSCADHGADQEAGPDEPDMLPVDRPAER
jgi:hypothetical protein